MLPIGKMSGFSPFCAALRISAAALSLLVLAACTGSTVGDADRGDQRDPSLPPVPPLSTLRPDAVPGAPGRADLYRRPIPPDGTLSVAVLLPLSGASARLGKSMLNAAEMAMFEIANDKFSLMPLDTKGTPEGAAAAAEQAIVGGAQLILGPLLASSVTAVAPLAGQAGIQVVAFSNSRDVAGEGVFIMGFVPKQQVDAIVDFATGHSLGRYAVLAPQDPYGQTVVQAMREAAEARGGTVAYTQFYDPKAKEFSSDVKTIADYERRRKALLAQRAMLQRQRDEVSRQALKRLEKRDTIGDVEFDAILIPETGQRLRALASLLSYYDVDPPAVRVLGLRNWDEIPKPGAEPALVGAWFAASPPEERQRFIDRYKATFGRAPARLASLAYDATALAAVLAQGESGPDFSYQALTNPNGFVGVDGLFRLDPSGVVERAFAILEVRKDGVHVLKPPRSSFEPFTN